jgi:signal transduction histidine kinase
MGTIERVTRRLQPGRTSATSTTIVMLVLVGSVAVATALAWQAMEAEQQRLTVSGSMIREYARLAAWEFSRQATKDVELAVMRTIDGRVHPARYDAEDDCDCEPIAGVDAWFELRSGHDVASESPALTMEMKAEIARVAAVISNGLPEGSLHIWTLPNDAQGRIAAMRREPYLGTAGGQNGFVIRPEALEPVMARAHRRTVLLPSFASDHSEAARFVDLRVHDRSGGVVFASAGTTAGSQGVETNLLSGHNVDLRVSTSMTPGFAAGLGPAYGVGPTRSLVTGLVAVNVLLVIIGIWQLSRERELARLRANFVAGVSHELRTPLAQIRMFAETLKLDRIRHPDERRRAVDVIDRETRRLGQLVENVLHFHGRDRLPTSGVVGVVDLVPFLEEVLEGFTPLAASSRVQLKWSTDVPEHLIAASPDGLRQVILNLLDNAVKFGPQGQTVSVALEAAGDCARIVIEDQGSGIREQDRERIFKAFERGRDTRGAGGAGIGLAVVRQIIEAHHGTVTVGPSSGGGARFVVTLPAAEDRRTHSTSATHVQ